MLDFRTDPSTPAGLPQTVDRALRILLAFDRESPEWGVTEISRAFGLHTSTAQRLLAALTHRGFLVRDDSSRRYRIGPAALYLGRVWDQVGALGLLAQPVLDELAAFTGQNILFALPDSAHMRTVLVAEGEHGRLRDYPMVNELYPAHAGATSKAYYAFLPFAQRKRLFIDRPLARFTANTATDLGRLERQFAQVRARGWAYTEGEYDEGVATLAVPVFLREEPYASLSVGWPKERLGEHPSDWVDALCSASERISLRLTHRGR